MAYDIGVRLGVDGEQAFRSSINAINANIKSMGSELKAVTAQFAKNADSEEALTAKNQVLAKSIAATKDKISVLDKQLERQAEKLRELGKAADEAAAAHGKDSEEALRAQNAYNNQAKAVAKLQDQLNGAKAELAGMENAVRDNQEAIDGLGREVEDAGEAMDEAGRSAVSFGDILKANIISDLVVDGIRRITDGLKDFARFSLESGMNFEAQMSRVQAISGATAEDAGRLAEKAKEMGETTVFSATESAQALEYMAMAGWKTDDMLDGLAGIMNLAAASGEDLAATSDIVTDALTAFGLTAADSTHFADVLAVASSNANTNVGMMGETFKYVAPVAGAMGYTVEDAAVAIGLMANSSIKASSAGTALRTLMTNMAKPTSDMADAMYYLGVSLTDDEGNMHSFMEVMDQLREGFKGGRISQEEYAAAMENWQGMYERGSVDLVEYTRAVTALDIALNGTNESQQAEIAAMLAGKEAMSGLLAIVNASPGDYQKLIDAIYDADGAAKEMSDTMVDNLAGNLKLMGSAAEGVGNALYEKFSEPLKGAAEGASRFLSGIKQMLEGTRTLKQFGYLLNSIFQNFILDATGSMGKTVSESWAMVTGMLKEKIVDSVASLSQYIQENMPSLISSGLDFLAGLASSIREGAGVMVDAGIQLVTSLAQGLADSFPTIIEKLPGIVSDIAGVINDNALKILAAGVNIVVTLGKGLIQAIPALVKNLPQIILAIVDVFSAFNWMNLGKNIMTGLNNGIKSLLGNVRTTAKTVVQNLRTVFGDLPGYLKAIGKDMIQGLWNGIKSMGAWLKEKVAGFISGIVGFLSGGMRNEAANAAKSAASSRSAAPAALAAEWVPDPEPFPGPFPGPFRAARFSGGEALSQAVTRSLSNAEAQTRASAAIRRVQRDMADAGASAAAYYTAPERRSGGNPPAGNAWNGITAAELASAIRQELNGMKVEMDGRTVGRLVATQQGNMGRALGTL